MQTTKQIIADFRANGVDIMSLTFGIRDIMALPKILMENEKALFCVQGNFGNRQGLLVISDKRVFFLLKGLLFGVKIEEFSYNKISAIYYEKGLLFGSITIATSGDNQKITGIQNLSIKKAIDLINEQMAASKSNINPQLSSNNSINLADQLRSLASLRDEGILTEEEFSEQKRKLLDGKH